MNSKNFRVFLRVIAVITILSILVITLNQHKSKGEKDNLSAKLAYIHVKSVVWYHSRGKLEVIRSILLNDDLNKVEKTKLKIENMLKHRTSVYITEFNHLKTPIPNMGDYYSSIFDFKSFLDKVFEITFDDQLSVNQRVVDITDVMELYQNGANDLVFKRMKNAEEANNE